MTPSLLASLPDAVQALADPLSHASACPVSQHTYEVAQMLQGLRARDKRAQNIDEAVQKGYLTDLGWCRSLDEYRELDGCGTWRTKTWWPRRRRLLAVFGRVFEIRQAVEMRVLNSQPQLTVVRLQAKHDESEAQEEHRVFQEVPVSGCNGHEGSSSDCKRRPLYKRSPQLLFKHMMSIVEAFSKDRYFSTFLLVCPRRRLEYPLDDAQAAMKRFTCLGRLGTVEAPKTAGPASVSCWTCVCS